MLVELSFLTAGIPLGYALRRVACVHTLTDQLLTWSVRLLLFLLGLSIGNNPDIMNNLDTLGIKSAFIALCSVLGSILLTRPLEPYIQKAIARVTGAAPSDSTISNNTPSASGETSTTPHTTSTTPDKMPITPDKMPTTPDQNPRRADTI